MRRRQFIYIFHAENGRFCWILHDFEWWTSVKDTDEKYWRGWPQIIGGYIPPIPPPGFAPMCICCLHGMQIWPQYSHMSRIWIPGTKYRARSSKFSRQISFYWCSQRKFSAHMTKRAWPKWLTNFFFNIFFSCSIWATQIIFSWIKLLKKLFLNKFKISFYWCSPRTWRYALGPTGSRIFFFHKFFIFCFKIYFFKYIFY